MILNDKQITELCSGDQPMLDPFVPVLTRNIELSEKKVISYGLSSFGYDVRLGYSFLMASPNQPKNHHLDPKNSEDFDWIPHHAAPDEQVAIPPGGFLLAETIEYFNMPEDVIGIVTGKSTYARCGIIINVTPLEPGWRGYLTLEIHNASRHSVIIYPGEGIAQINFHRGETPNVTYDSRAGKYQNQQGVTPPKI